MVELMLEQIRWTFWFKKRTQVFDAHAQSVPIEISLSSYDKFMHAQTQHDLPPRSQTNALTHKHINTKKKKLLAF